MRERLLLAPQDTGAMWELAILLENSGDCPGAIDLYQRALRVDPYRVAFLLELGRLWREMGDVERARSWFSRALSIDPDSAEAAAGLASLDGAEGLTEAYIRTLFDQYADRFDADLVGTLKYQAPTLVAALLARCGGAGADLLDLGCGTGLSGAALKPFARTIDGVDLSPGMIAKAEARRIYDTLAVGEAEAFLSGAAKSWDVIAAVDMLNYLGELTPIFRGIAARLRTGGIFAGTVEKRIEGGQALSEKRRYRHGEDHVRAALDAAGLALVELSEAVLRQEGGAPVAGIVFAARRRPG
ncbi:MAG TPA: methyltransferase [Alphaproteobacteria bacterium]|nr:methyltransferase [Alphaproteobacteria bacterium]